MDASGGIYWIFNNVFSCVQEIILTKYLRGKRDETARHDRANRGLHVITAGQ